MMRPIVIMSIGVIYTLLYTVSVFGDELIGLDDVTMQVIGADEVPDDVFEVIPFPRRPGQLIKKSPRQGAHTHEGETLIGPHDDNAFPTEIGLPHGIPPDGQIISNEEYNSFRPDSMIPPPGDFGADGIMGLPPTGENSLFEPPALMAPNPMDIPIDIDPTTGLPVGFDPNIMPPSGIVVPIDPMPMPEPIPIPMPEPVPIPMPDPNGNLPVDIAPGR